MPEVMFIISENFSQWALAFRKYETWPILLSNALSFLVDLSQDNLTLRITLPRNGAVSTLQTAIQNQLGPLYNNIPLDIRQVIILGVWTKGVCNHRL
jgi:hypothetical protein